MFIKYVKRILLNRDHTRAILENNLVDAFAAKYAEATKNLDKDKMEMNSKPCAVRRNMSTCSSECVHYEDGWVIDMRDVGHVGWRSPKCKLWKYENDS